MSTFLGGSEISGMHLGSNEISEMYLGGNLIYSSSVWPYETFRVSKDGGVTWEDYGGLIELEDIQFYNKGITHIELPDSLRSIGNDTFRNNRLTHVEFPETLGSIGYSAFMGNPNLTEVRISSQTTYTKTGASASFDSHTNIITY